MKNNIRIGYIKLANYKAEDKLCYKDYYSLVENTYYKTLHTVKL